MCSGEVGGAAARSGLADEADSCLFLAEEGFIAGGTPAVLPYYLDFFHSYSSFVEVVAYTT